MTESISNIGRSRVGWWIVVLVLAGAAIFLTYSFIGLVVLGIFGYYAARPIYRHLSAAIDTDGIAAGITLSVLIVPVILLVFYAGFQLVQQVQQFFGAGIGSFVRQYLGLGSLSNQQQRALTALLQQQSGQFINNPRQALRTVFQLGVRIVSAIVGTLLMLALAPLT
ncbi:MAG TPA: hypothetical protein VFJ06_00935 [Halococcus sp.]|nr:hypothetical protein [Halococcus sp.]